MARVRDDDACPGALQVHRAADGALIRIRLAGGAITPAQLAALAHTAEQFGSPAMELTSRGNIQIRAITDTAAVASAIAGAGLLPSPTHERVRNIVASPLSGRSGGLLDVRPLVTELDAELCAYPELAGLPGRFQFALDDGTGDVSGLRPDVGVHAVDADTFAVILAGRDSGVRIPVGAAVPTLISVAQRFVQVKGTAWRVAELADATVLLDCARPGPHYPAIPHPPVGWITQRDGLVSLGAAVPLGVLQARVAEFLAAVEAPLIITPWRSVVISDLDEGVADTALRVLAPLGLVFDESSPWLSLSACTGRPGCDKSLSDVRADAQAALNDGAPGVHRHFVGCPRACGSPSGAEVLIATGHGYQGRHP
ncbi:precorrin-3B synthase [Mycolicibacterium fluoranthenivorans]|uniref:Precorrin-3B synthase n=1 Tax=Mycolicibacterium fluoranthenivorans TaxID=258505 RepID=A0A7X5U0H8_9MYCO|nr:precorrin-3B synthase [Mycolicibacterium fluoranthenivorans]MCV7357742.1 precorrin-3B synthase [Mycolicibacterium fluoranthenivorans]NIH96142.1 precorrin-3B synthase [Mycolicibacterium fluoranthenivorans]